MPLQALKAESARSAFKDSELEALERSRQALGRQRDMLAEERDGLAARLKEADTRVRVGGGGGPGVALCTGASGKRCEVFWFVTQLTRAAPTAYVLCC